MRSTIFKLSTLSAVILAATQANAALYRIVEVPGPTLQNYNLQPDVRGTYGSAIEAGTGDCFTSACADNAYDLAGEILQGPEGNPYKDEVAFKVDNTFSYNSESDLSGYCSTYLNYATCGAWTTAEWLGLDAQGLGGFKRELFAWNSSTNYPSNASGFIEPTSTTAIDTADAASAPAGASANPNVNSKNIVITALDGTQAIGITSSGFYTMGATTKNAQVFRSRGFYDVVGGSPVLLPPRQGASAAIVKEMGRTFAYDSFTFGGKTYVVGAAAVAPYYFDDVNKDVLGDVSTCAAAANPSSVKACQTVGFALKPYVWDMTTTPATPSGLPAVNWVGMSAAHDSETVDNSREGNASAIGSVRAAVLSDVALHNGNPVLAGFNTQKDGSSLFMQAAVYYPKAGFTITNPEAWENKFITSATVKDGSDVVYRNSLAKDINKNLLVIGEAKRAINDNNALPNKMFIADASTGNPSANYFSGGIFFNGAGGEANAINNHNEIVGQVDSEAVREINGRERKHRAFIYPYNGTNSNATRMARFKNQAWWIDNLTNGGAFSSANNHFRVINASDINDAGVISATAVKCSAGEYDTTAHNALCGGGSSVEKIVAVKLIPINGATSADIVERSTTTTKVSRQGSGLGWITLTLLGLISFIRRK
ncbi:DUF3466 family protein [Vibrio sp. SCSIO 43137]|uniref:DUF3466 family protein n=1 Tax=Vibrio sp. SCSIO 43137 TaxID=3021011 RepID=UPI0023080125|nr:DUF3466 family protein [Vibrio sp. SCSIO 43137]WCE31092.1 DUF3466 family protein [Vibrio sp. SCSIO 43137]